MKEQFLIDPNITFLNFGSFGACPKPVFEKYQQLQLQLEREPVQFIVKDGMKLLAEARERLGDYLGCHKDDVVFVTNPSYAVNTIAKSFPFEKGDEILSTNLEYGALDRTWNYYAEKAGAKYIQQEITLPIQSKEVFIEDFWKGYSENTKAIFISHITSATGLILPVEEIVEEANKRGLITIVDGAHVPAQINLNIEELGADVYAGACHKWMMAPKGSSFLYVNQENQKWVDPAIISWGYDSDHSSHSQFLDYHQTNGTRDFTAFLTVPTCIDFMEQHNWREMAKRCQKIVIDNAMRFCDLVGSTPISPVNKEFIGQLFSIPIKTDDPMALHDVLFEKYNIEIPVPVENGNAYLRYSIQAFNDQTDLDRLYEVVSELLDEGKYMYR
jgi:isopenicillin-N epimerase